MKSDLRKKWALVHEFWCEWDPIGVFDDPINTPHDLVKSEYDAYVWPTIGILEKSNLEGELITYFRHVAEHTMGLTSYPNPSPFIKKMKKKYSELFKNSKN